MKCFGAEIADEMRGLTHATVEDDDVTRNMSMRELLDYMVAEGTLLPDTGDAFADYMRDFGCHTRVNRLGNMNMHEYRLKIARNPEYTDRCRSTEAFADCFDENGNVL